MRCSITKVLSLACVVFALTVPALAQSLPRIGVGAKVSTLGIGIEAATAVAYRVNVRGGFNFLGYDHDFSENGIDYAAQLRLRSAEVHLDWFLGAFRVSPGVLVYNGNRVEANATVGGGRSFTLGGRDYVSSTTDPVTGSARFDFEKRKISPMLTIGTGNLLRRSGRPFSITFDAGVVFEGTPKATLNLGGSTCATFAGGTGPCQSVASNAQVQSDMRAEEAKFNNGTTPYDTTSKVLKYYPVISIGFGYRIK